MELAVSAKYIKRRVSNHWQD